MTIDLHTLEARYLEFCKGQEVSPSSAILSGFLKAKLQKSRNEQCSLQIFVDKLSKVDFLPIIKLFSIIDSSEIDTIDILHGSRCISDGEYVLSLMRAVTQKLRIVDLHNLSFGKDFLRDLFRNGLTCQILYLRSSQIRKLNMVGNFIQLHTLNLDFSISLTGFREDCFNCMPNLIRVSMCETRVSNLWTTSAALSKLPSLVELRFQNCLCCNDTGPCSASSSEKPNPFASHTAHLGMYSTGRPLITNEGLSFQNSQCYHRRRYRNLVDDVTTNHEPLANITEESSDDSEEVLSSPQQRMELANVLANMFPELSTLTVTENEVNSNMFFPADEGSFFSDAFNSRNSTDGADASPKKYVPQHPSPICFEKHYREYMISALPQLKVLDNLPITDTDREHAKVICLECYESLPYNQKSKESFLSILEKREVGSTIGRLRQSSSLKQSLRFHKSQYFFSRSMSAAKVGSSAWPSIHPVLKSPSSMEREESKRFRPRQFEYHPSDSSLMAFGTLDGELVVINHENGNVVGYMSSGTLNSVLGICWLKTYPSKLIAGSDNGTLQLYDIRRMLPRVTDGQCTASIAMFDDFKQLTSVHVNSTDEHFIASGYSKDVALYDIGSGKRLQTFTDMHRWHINVVKFAHQSPSLFVTSSFDHDVKMWDLRQRPLRPCYTASSSRGNVMVCFSPDDHYLLTSAVDNEVRQLLAVDGRVHMKFEIAPSGSSQNYTRSYYMNGRDYIISGSSDEHVVRICCAQTGRRLRDVPLEARGSGTSLFVQSLRGDPFRDFHMSILAAYMRPSSKSEIIKVNLMTSSEHNSEYSHRRHFCPSSGMGA